MVFLISPSLIVVTLSAFETLSFSDFEPFHSNLGIPRAKSCRNQRITPIASNDGNRTGAMISSMESASRKKPMNNRTAPTASRNQLASEIIVVINWEMLCGNKYSVMA